MKVAAQLILTFLLNASWQIALVAGFALACDWLLRETAARYRHGVWVAALLLSLTLPLLSSASLVATSSGSKSKQRAVEIADAPVFITSVTSPDLDSMEPPTAENRVSPEAIKPARRNLLSSPIHLNRNAAAFLVGLYALFVLYRIGQLIRAWKRTQTIVQSAITFEPTGTVQAIIRKCQAATGVHRVRILCSTMVTVPSTVGILNPAIILPESLLQHVDDEVLTTAIGHELVHVARRDYLLNLIYEFIYLPLSFHPTAALVRRRIKQTRELCCDESVASRLLQPEIYARSLVRLIGAASPLRHASADTTIGINESDILEVRIMTLLKTRKLTARRKGLSFVAAASLLAAPCIAATSLALNFEIDQQEPTPNTAQAHSKREQDQVRERMGETRQREELKRAVEQLKEQIKVAPESKRGEIEARLREVQQNLELHERALEQYKQTREARQKRLEELRVTLAQYEGIRPADEARMKETRDQIAQLVRLYTSEKEREVEKTIAERQRLETDRKPRVIYKVEPEYTEDAREKKIEGTVVLTLTVDHQGLPQNIQVKRALYPSLDQSAIEAARKMRFQPAMKDGQPASTVITVEFHFDVDIPSKDEFEATKKRIQEEREGQGESAFLEMRRRKEVEQQGREERARKQAELTRGATLSMDRAIQIATSQVPGKVLACSLGRDGDKIFYHVVIIGGDGDKTTTTYVWVSATDGQILKTEKEKEERKEEFLESRNDLLPESGPNAPIQGGVLNGKATSLPPPAYPAIARQAHASGAVNVQVLISEGGEVVAAHAVSGHPLLQAAAVKAARQASFTPTRLNGEPVRVSGILVYNFVAQ